MTNHWIDIKNIDCIQVIGANTAENHPNAFKYVMQAKDNGTRLICVDPRYTRTAAVADIYAPLRSGTDIAFQGGMIKYILDNNNNESASEIALKLGLIERKVKKFLEREGSKKSRAISTQEGVSEKESGGPESASEVPGKKK